MNPEKILGIEGGGTKTAWVLIAGDAILDSAKLPPSNLRLTSSEQLKKIFRALPSDPQRVGVFLAGCVTEEDRRQLLALGREVWPGAQIVVGSDRESGMAASLRERDGIVVNAGTGSSVTGRRDDQIERAGGWGHILGDTGGAYFVSIRALRLVLRDYDLRRGNRKFAANVLSALALNSFDELVRWAQTADKTEIAALAPIVFAAASHGEEPVQRIISASAAALADFTTAVAARLRLRMPEVRLMGGLFEHQRAYADAFEAALQEKLPEANVLLSSVAPELGAAWLASEGKMQPVVRRVERSAAAILSTEERNSKSENLERLSVQELVELFVGEEKHVEAALRQRINELGLAIEMTSETLAHGGHVFYVGAGTSGRLGVLDAAEVAPTFGAPPDFIRAIIAGGAPALQRSVEGAEDDVANGALALDTHDLAKKDLVIGISASGSTPFVVGALDHARETGAKTIFLTCNPGTERTNQFDLVIELPTGPEILTGSTRLKAGTATKVALNIISTGAMIRLGRVQGNLMIDLQPTNKKLRDRAVRVVAHLRGCKRTDARDRLERAGWNVRAALKE